MKMKANNSIKEFILWFCLFLLLVLLVEFFLAIELAGYLKKVKRFCFWKCFQMCEALKHILAATLGSYHIQSMYNYKCISYNIIY